MFFIGVFGIENKNKEIKYIDNLNCKNCNRLVRGRLVKNFNFFHFFFIPIFKWNEEYYIICEDCNSTFAISKEKGKSIEKGENVEVTYWDLKEINRRYINKCLNCGREVNENFDYCPYCGNKIK